MNFSAVIEAVAEAVVEPLVERLGEAWTLTLLGAAVGLLFGFFAQRSRICLRSAVIEFARNVTGGKLLFWPALFSELKLEGFEGGRGMRRYIAGAMLMGCSGMLAGRCAVGAGLSGAAVFALTAWATLASTWAAAAVTDRLVDMPSRPSHAGLALAPANALPVQP